MRYLYNLALLIASLYFVPQMFYTGKHKHLLKKKGGSSFKNLKKEKAPLVWIHAVSMGETKAIWKCADLLKKKYPHLKLLITSTTDTGHAEAKRSLPFADHHLYLPFDFSWIIRPIVNKIKPELVIISETDHWFNFLEAAKENEASIAVINGKLSTRSLERYRWLGPFLDRFFAPLDLICAQNSTYEKRFIDLGIDSKKLFITGNLKFDAPAEKMGEEEKRALKHKLGIQDTDFVIIAGSTHADEETLIFEAFNHLLPQFPHLKLIVVPRHPERFSQVEKLLGNPYKFSSPQNASGHEKAILIDAMGQLKKCYQIGNLAFVCGSFVAHVGGHNIMEPSFYGVPVLFGPFMHTQPELVELMLEAKAGLQLTRENLQEQLRELLLSKDKQKELSIAGKTLTDGLQGTSEKTLHILEKEFNLSQRFSLAK